MSTRERAKAREVVPNVYQLMLGGRSAHSYLLKGRRSNVLIDSGLPSHWDEQVSALAGLGLKPSDINLVLLTHEHIDHAGGASLFPPGTLIGAHRLAASKLAVKDEFALMNQAFALDLDDFYIDLLLAEGTEVDLGDFHLRVIHTPGHCSGAVCFLETAHGLLFSGDTVMANGVIGGVLGSGNISDYLDSVRQLSTLRVEKILPGHGRVSTDSASDIKRAIERLDLLLEESKILFDAVRHSQDSFDQIVRSLRNLNL
jgi:glyoxylase-like metal-dependent hydrolase (beta-lactamase superfamily II)